MKNVKAAIFDMDGTLLDSMPVWINCGELYVQSLGLKPEEGLGKKLLSMNMKQGAEYLSKKYGIKLSILEICQGINGILKDSYANKIVFKIGAEKFLKNLKERGTKIALCTNTDRELFSPALKRLDANKYFDGIFTTSEMQTSKSHPEIFYSVAEFLKSVPEETWVFEDALYAIRTANLAGFKTCGIYDESYKNVANEIKKFSTIYCENYEEAENFFIK